MKRRYSAGILAGIMLISTGLTSGCAKKQEEVPVTENIKVTPMQKEEANAVSFAGNTFQNLLVKCTSIYFDCSRNLTGLKVRQIVITDGPVCVSHLHSI